MAHLPQHTQVCPAPFCQFDVQGGDALLACPTPAMKSASFCFKGQEQRLPLVLRADKKWSAHSQMLITHSLCSENGHGQLFSQKEGTSMWLPAKKINK